MGIKIRDELGILRTVTRIRFRDASNVLRTIQTVKMRDDGNTLRTVFVYLSAALSTTVLIGVDSGASVSGDVTSGSVTCNVTGGTSPFTYNWELVSGTALVTIDSPTSASTTFTVTGAFDGVDYNATFKCTVTDDNGIVAESNTVFVQIYWVSTL